MAQSPEQSGWGLIHWQARCDYHPWRQCSLYGLSLQLDNGDGSSHHALRWIASRGDSLATHAIILTDSMSLLQKVKSGMWRPDWNVSMVDINLPKLLLVYCPGYAGVNGNNWADRLAGKATITSGLLLGRYEVLSSLRHYLRAQNQGRHTIDRLEERGVERGSARRSSLKGRESAVVYQTNIRTVSRATLGKLLRDGVERIWACPSA